MDISIIIVNYKTVGLVKQSLRRLQNMDVQFLYEVIVVDNNSKDGCIKMIQEHYPSVITIGNDSNIGFGAGNNVGIKKTKGRYIFILNADVAVVSSELVKLFNFLEKREDVALVGPRLVNPDGSIQLSCFRFPTTCTPIYSRTFLKRIERFKKVYDHYRMVDFNHDKTIPVHWLVGGCMLIRKDIFTAVGGFDERYFMYYEDIDLCRTLWQNNHKVYYVHNAELVHYHQRESADDGFLHSLRNKTLYYHLSSWRKYVQKYLGKNPPPIEKTD